VRRWLIIVVALATLLLVSCQSKGPPTDNPNSVVNEAITPKEGQPAFPPLSLYWVVDACGCFSLDQIKMADQVFESLRQDGIAEVVVICQKGIKNKGSLNDELIWTRDWGRWARLGDKKTNRAIVWLIRPDVKPEANRVTIEVSNWLYWYTAVDYGDALQEAADYANQGDFDGALESIVRNTDQQLRMLWPQHKEE
jgi:uncharacterized membrane protein YgcG